MVRIDRERALPALRDGAVAAASTALITALVSQIFAQKASVSWTASLFVGSLVGVGNYRIAGSTLPPPPPGPAVFSPETERPHPLAQARWDKAVAGLTAPCPRGTEICEQKLGDAKLLRPKNLQSNAGELSIKLSNMSLIENKTLKCSKLRIYVDGPLDQATVDGAPPQAEWVFGPAAQLSVSSEQLGKWVAAGKLNNVRLLDLRGCTDLTLNTVTQALVMVPVVQLRLPEGFDLGENKIADPIMARELGINSWQNYSGPNEFGVLWQVEAVKRGHTSVFGPDHNTLDPLSVQCWLQSGCIDHLQGLPNVNKIVIFKGMREHPDFTKLLLRAPQAEVVEIERNPGEFDNLIASYRATNHQTEKMTLINGMRYAITAKNVEKVLLNEDLAPAVALAAQMIAEIHGLPSGDRRFNPCDPQYNDFALKFGTFEFPIQREVAMVRAPGLIQHMQPNGPYFDQNVFPITVSKVNSPNVDDPTWPKNAPIVGEKIVEWMFTDRSNYSSWLSAQNDPDLLRHLRDAAVGLGLGDDLGQLVATQLETLTILMEAL